MDKTRPSFKKPKAAQQYLSPEELFAKLPNRATSHGYLRAPQVDALRDYEKLVGEPDIAFELPTGTGKTAVGLIIAEWRRRRSGGRVAYLTLTNQLAKQILREAGRLGLDCADLTGNKDTRKAAEVGRYNIASAVGVTTYSNLFNVNPVIQPSDVLILDDAHGGEHFVSEMWTVRIEAGEHVQLYRDVLTALRPALTESQLRIVTDETDYGSIELADTMGHPHVFTDITALLDKATDSTIHFPWGLIRNHLSACLFFASIREIVIRPLVPPTHTHAPFFESKQRIYMSATLGGQGDLQRSYGVINVKPIRAKHAQWGKRYIFVPGIFMEEARCAQLVADVWNEMKLRRGLLLAPSFTMADKAFGLVTKNMKPKPVKLGAKEIEDNLEPFSKSKNSILCLAGRYDGIDLPGDDCRLLIMAESPSAVGTLERHLREHWKLGPLLRRRERIRLVQGMGRCTRDATDYAVILLLGQSLVNSCTTPAMVEGLPGEIQRELKWGIEQCETGKKDAGMIKEITLGLLSDANYRKEANESVEEVYIPPVKQDPHDYDKAGKLEVNYSSALWAEDYSHALEVARGQADETNAPELAGYRAWWWFLAAVAARLLEETETENDCLTRGRKAGINSGFLDHLLRARSKKDQHQTTSDPSDVQAEAIWRILEQWGWQGPEFGKKLAEMEHGLSEPSSPTQFNIGLERVGECIGARVIRPTGEGAPDVVWVFHDKCFTFENKSDKKTGGALAKKEILQAKGHPDWFRANYQELKNIVIQPMVASPVRDTDVSAKPHTPGLFYVSIDALREVGKTLSGTLSKIRTTFAGKEYPAVRDQLRAAIRSGGINRAAIDKLLSAPLA